MQDRSALRRGTQGPKCITSAKLNLSRLSASGVHSTSEKLHGSGASDVCQNLALALMAQGCHPLINLLKLIVVLGLGYMPALCASIPVHTPGACRREIRATRLGNRRWVQGLAHALRRAE
eukprot:3138284-Amphidinium_carterae.1